MLFPPAFALKATFPEALNNYLCVDDYGLLRYNNPKLGDKAKFEVEQAESDTTLVHIRCCHNNNYLSRNSQMDYMIIGRGSERVEDTSAWSCTLFKPEFNKNGIGEVEFVHVSSGRPLRCFSGQNESRAYELTIHTGNNTVIARSEVVDYYESLPLLLPNLVAIIGHNGKYLESERLLDDRLMFVGEDLGSLKAHQEIFPGDDDGYIRFKNNRFPDNWWFTTSTGRISAAGTGDNVRPEVLFLPVKAGGNFIALRSKRNNKFLRSTSRTEGNATYVDTLFALADSIVEAAKFRVVEPILERSIREVNYHLDRALVYGRTALVVATQTGTNPTDNPQSMTLNFTYTDAASRTWSKSRNYGGAISVKLYTGLPTLVGKELTVSGHYSETVQWGETIEKSQQTQTGYTTTVPGRTKMTIRLMALRGSCNVPFTYRQTDRLTDGREVIVTEYDGMFTGVNAYDFRYETEQESLPEALWI